MTKKKIYSMELEANKVKSLVQRNLLSDLKAKDFPEGYPTDETRGILKDKHKDVHYAFRSTKLGGDKKTLLLITDYYAVYFDADKYCHVFMLADCTMESKTTNSYGSSGELVYEDASVVKGAVVGGMVAGAPGAVVGAVVNKDRKVPAYRTSGFTSEEVIDGLSFGEDFSYALEKDVTNGIARYKSPLSASGDGMIYGTGINIIWLIENARSCEPITIEERIAERNKKLETETAKTKKNGEGKRRNTLVVILVVCLLIIAVAVIALIR